MFPLFFHQAPVGFAVTRVQIGDLYDLVGTDLTGKQRKHIDTSIFDACYRNRLPLLHHASLPQN